MVVGNQINFVRSATRPRRHVAFLVKPTQGRRSAKLNNLKHSIPTKPDQFALNTTKFALATAAKNLMNKYML